MPLTYFKLLKVRLPKGRRGTQKTRTFALPAYIRGEVAGSDIIYLEVVQ